MNAPLRQKKGGPRLAGPPYSFVYTAGAIFAEPAGAYPGNQLL